MDTKSSQHHRVESILPVTAIQGWAMQAIWFLVFAIVALNAAVLAFLANIYTHYRTHDSFLWVCRVYFFCADANAFVMNYRMFVAVVYASLAAVFIFYAINLVWAGRHWTDQLWHFGSMVTASLSRICHANRQRTPILRKLCWRPLVDNLSKWRYDFGVQGPLFEVRLLLDEAIEIVTQTYCIYTASLSISNAPLNLCYAAVIFVNTFSTLLVRQLYKHSLVKQRIAWFVSDFLLDFLWGTVIPVWMSLSLYNTYTSSSTVVTDFNASANSTREVERVRDFVGEFPCKRHSVLQLVPQLV